MSKTIKWFRISGSAEEIIFQENNIAVVQCDGKNICIGKYQQQLFGFAYKCPHAGGIMANGFIDALGNVVCPLHRYKFSMNNGRNISGEGYHLKTYPLEIREDGCYLGIEESKFSLW